MFGGIVDNAAPRAVRLRDHDRGVALLFFSVGERPVRCQCWENIGMAIVPIPVPAVERFVLGARIEVMLFVDQRVAVGRPCGRAHGLFKAWPARGVKDALLSSALAQKANLAGAEELMVDLEARARGMLEVLSRCHIDRDDL